MYSHNNSDGGSSALQHEVQHNNGPSQTHIEPLSLHQTPQDIQNTGLIPDLDTAVIPLSSLQPPQKIPFIITSHDVQPSIDNEYSAINSSTTQPNTISKTPSPNSAKANQDNMNGRDSAEDHKPQIQEQPPPIPKRPSRISRVVSDINQHKRRLFSRLSRLSQRSTSTVDSTGDTKSQDKNDFEKTLNGVLGSAPKDQRYHLTPSHQEQEQEHLKLEHQHDIEQQHHDATTKTNGNQNVLMTSWPKWSLDQFDGEKSPTEPHVEVNLHNTKSASPSTIILSPASAKGLFQLSLEQGEHGIVNSLFVQPRTLLMPNDMQKGTKNIDSDDIELNHIGNDTRKNNGAQDDVICVGQGRVNDSNASGAVNDSVTDGNDEDCWSVELFSNKTQSFIGDAPSTTIHMHAVSQKALNKNVKARWSSSEQNTQQQQQQQPKQQQHDARLSFQDHGQYGQKKQFSQATVDAIQEVDYAFDRSSFSTSVGPSETPITDVCRDHVVSNTAQQIAIEVTPPPKIHESHAVLTPLPQFSILHWPNRSNWSDSSFCHACRHTFTFFKRRHHCRGCGQVFCNQCSKFQLKKEDAYVFPQNEASMGLKNVEMSQNAVNDPAKMQQASKKDDDSGPFRVCLDCFDAAMKIKQGKTSQLDSPQRETHGLNESNHVHPGLHRQDVGSWTVRTVSEDYGLITPTNNSQSQQNFKDQTCEENADKSHTEVNDNVQKPHQETKPESKQKKQPNISNITAITRSPIVSSPRRLVLGLNSHNNSNHIKRLEKQPLRLVTGNLGRRNHHFRLHVSRQMHRQELMWAEHQQEEYDQQHRALFGIGGTQDECDVYERQTDSQQNPIIQRIKPNDSRQVFHIGTTPKTTYHIIPTLEPMFLHHNNTNEQVEHQLYDDDDADQIKH